MTTPDWLSDLRPVVYVVAQDRLLLKDVEGAVRAAVVRGAADFNVDRLDARDLKPQGFRAAVGQLPVFAERRLTIVDGFEQGAGELKRAVAEYLDAPNPTTVVLLLAAKAEPGGAFVKRVEGRGRFVKLEVPRGRGLAPWIRDRAQGRGVTMSAGAAALLADLVGGDVGRLDQITDQLRCYSAGDPVGEDEVSELVVATRAHSVFELLDAIGAGRPDGAIEQLSRLMAQRESPVLVLSMLARHVRQLLVAFEIAGRRGSPGEVSERLHVPPFAATKLLAQSRRIGARALARALHELAETDVRLKSSLVPPDVILERAVMRLARLATC